MAEQNLDIVIRVRGGQVAASEIKGVAGSTETLGTATQETTKKSSRLGSTLKGLAGAFAVYKAYGFIKGAVNNTAELAKATAGLQRITGMDTQTSAGWITLAKSRGVQTKALNMGFITLARNLSAASQGSKGAQQAFAALGLNAAALKQQTPTVQMSMLAESFKALPPGADRAALAQKLFGRQAQTMLPLLAQGGKALTDQVAALGKQSGMTDRSVKKGLELAKQQRALKTAMLGVQVAIGTALVPILTALGNVITPLAQHFATLMQNSKAFRVAVYAVTAALTAYIIKTKLSTVWSAVAKAATIAWEGAQWLLNAALAASPLTLVVIGIAAIAAAIVALYLKCAWFRNAVQGALGGVRAAFGWVKQAAVDVFNWVKAHWPLLAVILGGPVGGALALLIKNFRTVKSVVGDVFGAAKSVIDSVASSLQSVFNTLWRIAHLPGKVFGAAKNFIGKLNPFQSGGHVTSPTMALVGEAGPEVVALPGGTTVYPNESLGGFGGPSVVHTHVYIGPREIAHAVGTYVAGQQAAR